MDIFDKIKNNKGPLGQYQKSAHGYFMFPKLEGEIGPRMKFRGKEVLNWSLNNYLGLANHPEVRKADAQGAIDFGMGAPMGARMMSGQTKYHEELEPACRIREKRRCLFGKLRVSGNDFDNRHPVKPSRCSCIRFGSSCLYY